MVTLGIIFVDKIKDSICDDKIKSNRHGHLYNSFNIFHYTIGLDPSEKHNSQRSKVHLSFIT